MCVCVMIAAYICICQVYNAMLRVCSETRVGGVNASWVYKRSVFLTNSRVYYKNASLISRRVYYRNEIIVLVVAVHFVADLFATKCYLLHLQFLQEISFAPHYILIHLLYP